MKTAIGLLTLALVIAAAVPAAADPVPLRLNPPKQYDRPYTGVLVVLRADSQQRVRELCPGTVFGWIGALACADVFGGWCRVVLAQDEVITKAGFPPEILLRHEIAHCNGWPADHKGAQVFEDWASTPPTTTDPVQYAASQFDEFAFNAVRKTVAEVAKNLAQSNKRAAAQFVVAAKGVGLAPESQVTGQVLIDPAAAAALARAVGIGTDLSDDQWQQAHAIAVQASRARQAENAGVPNRGQAAPQPQQAQPAPPGAAPQ